MFFDIHVDIFNFKRHESHLISVLCFLFAGE